MATNLVTNGTFASAITGWTAANIVQSGTPYRNTPGCAKATVSGALGDGTMTQNLTTGGSTGTFYRHVIRAWLYAPVLTTPKVQIRLFSVGLGAVYFDQVFQFSGAVQWHECRGEAWLPGNTTPITLAFIVDKALSGVVDLDDVVVAAVADTGITPWGLVQELEKRRRDMGAALLAEARYEELLARAMREMPRALWRVDQDTSLATVADTRRYSLATLTDITEAAQVRRVWIHDGESPGQYRRIGRWEVDEDVSTGVKVLTLALDDVPDEAALTIKLEYARPHDALDFTNPAQETTADREWLLARAMTLALMEADPTLEDANLTAAELQRWDQVRQARELELLGRTRRVSGKARTRRWDV